MTWLIAIGGLAIGIVIGVVFANRLGTSPARVKELENQIRQLKQEHGNYRNDVSDHFSMTAELVQHMTESYRDVYQHLANGAQDLCSTEVAGKLLPARSGDVFDSNSDEEGTGLMPPKDYAAKQNPGQKGALSEEFVISKSKQPVNDEEIPAQANKQH
ncbi:MAG: DUF1043 family protein [Gammaproteobacteria bacterium]